MTATVGADVKQERIRRGLTARQAAALAGVAYKTWLRIEAGQPVRNMSWLGVDRLFDLAPGEALAAVSNGRDFAATLGRTVRTSVVDEPIADTLERLAVLLRKAGRVVLNDNADLKQENLRLREALDLLRPAHHTPYEDEEHQGGNCVDWIMPMLAKVYKAEIAIRSAVSLLDTLTEAHASIVMDNAEDTAAQDQLVAASRRGVSALRSILAEVSS
jgi:hypothetical protein